MSTRVLVVDDDQGILEAVAALLESVGLTVETSLDGASLAQLTPGTLPDFILLDVLLSGSDGRELCRQLKQQRTTKKIPVVLTSADPQASTNLQKCGADGFLAKPFEMNSLLRIIEEHSP